MFSTSLPIPTFFYASIVMRSNLVAKGNSFCVIFIGIFVSFFLFVSRYTFELKDLVWHRFFVFFFFEPILCIFTFFIMGISRGMVLFYCVCCTLIWNIHACVHTNELTSSRAFEKNKFIVRFRNGTMKRNLFHWNILLFDQYMGLNNNICPLVSIWRWAKLRIPLIDMEWTFNKINCYLGDRLRIRYDKYQYLKCISCCKESLLSIGL